MLKWYKTWQKFISHTHTVLTGYSWLSGGFVLSRNIGNKSMLLITPLFWHIISKITIFVCIKAAENERASHMRFYGLDLEIVHVTIFLPLTRTNSRGHMQSQLRKEMPLVGLPGRKRNRMGEN